MLCNVYSNVSVFVELRLLHVFFNNEFVLFMVRRRPAGFNIQSFVTVFVVYCLLYGVHCTRFNV